MRILGRSGISCAAAKSRGLLSAVLGSLFFHAGVGVWLCWPASTPIVMPQQHVVEVAILMETAPQGEGRSDPKDEEKEESTDKAAGNKTLAAPDSRQAAEIERSDKAKGRPSSEPDVAPPQEPSPQQHKSEPAQKGPLLPVSGPQAASATAPNAAIIPPVFNAAYLENMPPGYPPAARRRNIEGKVLLYVEVSEDGVAQSVSVAHTSGSALLDEAARRAVLTWRFVPARQGDRNVAAGVTVPIVFTLR